MAGGKIAAACYGLAGLLGLLVGGGPVAAFLVFWIGGAAATFAALLLAYANVR